MVESAREARRHLYEVMAADVDLDAKLQRALALGQDYLGVDHAHLTRIEADTNSWQVIASTDPPDGLFPADLRHDLDSTFCRHVIEQGESLPLHDVVAQGWADDVAYAEHGISCYHGTPLLIDGTVFGTLCFVSESAREAPFSEADTTFAELVARTVEHEMQRDRTARKLERLDEFASVISHDLRNPLNVAQLRAEMLPADDENAAIIKRSLERMETLISNVLTMAREGRDVEETEAVSLSGIANTAWTSLDTVDAELVLEGDFEFMADRDRLRRVFENLFRNAVEHGGDAVTVRVGPLQDRTGFFVEDDGPGVPEEAWSEVFEAGFTTSEDGLGLGLAIVASIADAHGWQVGVTDAADGGARFEFSALVIPEPADQPGDGAAP